MAGSSDAVDVTILMPTLNASAFVGEALASIQHSALAAQMRVEVLLLDGGSTDQTVEIGRSYEPLVRISVEQDDGLYRAMSRGLTMARGEVVGWLNADEILDSEGALRVVEALARDSTLDVAYGDYMEMREGGEPSLRRQGQDALARFAAGDLNAFVVPITAYWRRRTLAGLGGWVPSFRIVADQELWIRAAATHPTIRERHIDAVVGTFRVHAGSLSSGEGHLERVNREYTELYRRARAYPGIPSGLARAMRTKRRELVMWFAGRHWRQGHLRAAYATIRELADPLDGVASTVGLHLLESLRWRLARVDGWVGRRRSR